MLVFTLHNTMTGALRGRSRGVLATAQGALPLSFKGGQVAGYHPPGASTSWSELRDFEVVSASRRIDPAVVHSSVRAAPPSPVREGNAQGMLILKAPSQRRFSSRSAKRW
jgi:hypothetical protein